MEYVVSISLKLRLSFPILRHLVSLRGIVLLLLLLLSSHSMSITSAMLAFLKTMFITFLNQPPSFSLYLPFQWVLKTFSVGGQTVYTAA